MQVPIGGAGAECVASRIVASWNRVGDFVRRWSISGLQRKFQ